jgi:thiamine kinase-like enzyme
MEYLPGRPLDYQSDLEGAASCFAAIHELPPADDLIVQAQPVRDILNECEELLGRYTAHPRKELTPLLATYKRKIERLADSPATAFADDRLCVVNTEVNSGNFVVDDAVRLVDWEKAVISYRYQDLGHFLVPTTTLWKTDYEFTEVDRRRFLTLYHDAAHPAVSLDHLDEYTAVLEKTILLRAFSWCYMATAEYAMGDRSLQNADTLETMDFYLSNAERFLDLS